MMSRTLVICLMTMALAYAAPSDSEMRNPGDLTECDPKPDDIILLDVQVEDKGHKLATVGIDVTYPSKKSTRPNTITCIKALNAAGSSGTAKLTDGHVGEKTVTMHLSAPASKSANFAIQIKGHPS